MESTLCALQQPRRGKAYECKLFPLADFAVGKFAQKRLVSFWPECMGRLRYASEFRAWSSEVADMYPYMDS